MPVKKIVILCGGTGGHFYPGLTIARKFTEHGGNVELFLIGRHSGNQAEIAESYGIESTVLPQLPAPVGVGGKLLFTLSLCKSFFSVMRSLRKEKPDAVLGMGSFTSLPTALAAKLMRIPLYLHDGNARVGKANVFLSRWAKKIMLSFPPVNADQLRTSHIVTGMPLRPELHADTFKQQTRKSLIEEFNEKFNAKFKIRPKVILVFGGSQGATVFNTLFPEGVLEIEDSRKIQVIHLTGKGNEAEVQIRYKNANFAYKIIETTEDMSLLYSLADIIFCRSGGSTVAELALFAKFAVLIPYPFATDDHQSDNADFYISSGAGIKVSNSDCSSAKFAEILREYLAEPAKFAELGSNGASLARPDAADDVLKAIQE
jgi:UDP-N-acetylglucosamine--N-acetylmuramyl-(pentapeptide) pyrophosphoryl-undecaprenol N-acetylglucosamine transferase